MPNLIRALFPNLIRCQPNQIREFPGSATALLSEPGSLFNQVREFPSRRQA
jgi:hypothetical protein